MTILSIIFDIIILLSIMAYNVSIGAAVILVIETMSGSIEPWAVIVILIGSISQGFLVCHYLLTDNKPQK